ncbi:NAD(P)H-hydrate dehydratase [Paucihalobacter sp.]|uniref:NAD(P)H-hydrate dehydratase n=1 Tax=Paucihalobacter sp. TaxID=2850405 RepID=UPI002FE3AD3C
MKVYSKKQIYNGDKITIEREGITSVDLMERAATEVFNWMHSRMQGAQVPIHVFCGIGNNGGDGLVLARHLVNHGYNVKVYVVNCSDRRSKDFLVNYERLKQTSKNWPALLKCASDFPEIYPDDIIVDAIFGIGLNRPVDVWISSLFRHFRNSKAFTLSIDIPSGLFIDAIPQDDNNVVWANYTLSFQSPKLVFFLPQTAKFTQQWEVLDVGWDADYLQSTETEAQLISKFEVLPLYKPRDKFAHKGNFGHTLIIGGSYGKIGAVNLSARSSLATGAGMVTVYVPKCGYIPIQTNFPEAMVITDVDDDVITDIKYDLKPSAIGIGMGLGTNEATILALESFLKNQNSPIVMDADALNIVSKKRGLIKLIPELSILTPHPKELERLVGVWKDDFDKISKVKLFSKKHSLIIVIKGFNTMTVLKDKLYINTTGNPGLATAGTGDVLTGIISALISQGYEPLDAAAFGVYLHGKSADIKVQTYGYQSLIASNVIEGIADAFLDLFTQPEVPVENDTDNV